MPRYEFECVECDYTVDQTRSISDDTPVLCRVCSAVMRKVYTSIPAHFKGDGFNSKGGK